MLERLNREKDQSGQITVFLTLQFVLMLGIAFLCFGGMREYLKGSLIEDHMDLAADDILAQYDRSLFDRYHLFFMDPRENATLTQDGETIIRSSLENHGFFTGVNAELSLDWQKSALTKRGEPVKLQIKEWETAQSIYKIPELMNQLLKSTEKSENVNHCLTDSEHEDTSSSNQDSSRNSDVSGEEDVGKKEQEETEEEKKIKKNWKEWKGTLESVLHSGILFYALDHEKNSISNLELTDKASLPSKELGSEFSLFHSGNISLTTFSGLKGLYEKGYTANRNDSLLSSDLYMIPYILECFTDYQKKDQSKKHCLMYEKEYLIAGKTKDNDNLKYVADQIFLLRFMVNFGYAINDFEIKGEADTMAAVLTGILGFPVAQKAVSMLLIASLCYGESLLEVRALFQGKKVALLKNHQNWNLYFHNALWKLKNKSDIIPVENGVNYEQYLIGLLILKSTNRKLLYRMMDLMQSNVGLDEPGFRMKDCIYAYRWTGTFTWAPMFRKIPAMNLIWQDSFKMKLSRTVNYQ